MSASAKIFLSELDDSSLQRRSTTIDKHAAAQPRAQFGVGPGVPEFASGSGRLTARTKRSRVQIGPDAAGLASIPIEEMGRSFGICTLRLASSTTRPGQTVFMMASFETSSPCRSAKRKKIKRGAHPSATGVAAPA